MLRKEAGDEIAKIFKDLMRKNAAGCGSHDAVDVEVSEAKDHHSHAYDMKDHHSHAKDGYSSEDHMAADGEHHGHARDHHHAYHAHEADDDVAMNMMIDFLDDQEEVSAAEDTMHHLKDHMKSNFSDDEETKKMASLMSGLGKIAGSLRKKGEGFAADVVEATAISIDKDFRKTASKNNSTISELEKIAKELRESKNSFAADLVDSTIRKIK